MRRGGGREEGEEGRGVGRAEAKRVKGEKEGKEKGTIDVRMEPGMSL